MCLNKHHSETMFNKTANTTIVSSSIHMKECSFHLIPPSGINWHHVSAFFIWPRKVYASESRQYNRMFSLISLGLPQPLTENGLRRIGAGSFSKLWFLGILNRIINRREYHITPERRHARRTGCFGYTRVGSISPMQDLTVWPPSCVISENSRSLAAIFLATETPDIVLEYTSREILRPLSMSFNELFSCDH